MSLRPEIFQDVVLKRLDIHTEMLKALSDTQFQLGQFLIPAVQHLKEADRLAAQKLQDDLSVLHGKIVALQPPKE